MLHKNAVRENWNELVHSSLSEHDHHEAKRIITLEPLPVNLGGQSIRQWASSDSADGLGVWNGFLPS